MIKRLISLENEKRGFECLFLLSLSHDDFCLGKDKDKGKDDEREKDKERVNEKHNRNEKEGEKNKVNLKSKRNNVEDKNDSVAWVRCLIVVEKNEKTEIKGETETVESIEKNGENALKNVLPVQCGSQRCLPNIFKKKTKSIHNENIENESEKENEKENRSEMFADKILFPGFLKDLFSASWRGGKIFFCIHFYLIK